MNSVLEQNGLQNGTRLYLPNKIGTSPTSGHQVRTGPGWHISVGFSRGASAGELPQPGIGGPVLVLWHEDPAEAGHVDGVGRPERCDRRNAVTIYRQNFDRYLRAQGEKSLTG